MSNIVAPKLTDITAMFNSCSVLETVDFRGIDTSKLTNSSSVFNDVNGAKIYVSSNTDKTNIENMLTASSASANVLVKQFKYYNGIYLQYILFSCYSILNMLNYKKLGGTYVTS